MPSRPRSPLRSPSLLSTTHIGRSFENHTLRYLNEYLHMTLRRVGGAGDEGIDLTGWWTVPPLSKQVGVRRLRVIAQCKAEAKPLNGRAVRELEGVMAHLTGPSAFQAENMKIDDDSFPMLSVLASQSGFSTAATTRALRSPTPMLLLHLPGGRPDEERNEMEVDEDEKMVVTGAFMNPALSSEGGLLGGILDLRREELDGGGSRYRMWSDGKPMVRQETGSEEDHT